MWNALNLMRNKNWPRMGILLHWHHLHCVSWPSSNPESKDAVEDKIGSCSNQGCGRPGQKVDWQIQTLLSNIAPLCCLSPSKRIVAFYFRIVLRGNQHLFIYWPLLMILIKKHLQFKLNSGLELAIRAGMRKTCF